MSIFALTLLLSAPFQDGAGEELRYDNRGRPVVSVQVNDKGPFDMVLDTAAQSSLLAPALAAQLGLAPLNSDLRISGATGSAATKIYPVDRLSNRLVEKRFVGVLEFPNPETTPARGILGMEHFVGRKLLFDRTAHRVIALPSGPAAAGFATLTGKRREDGLVQVPVRINGVVIDALVDTGAAVSIANAAALKALGWASGDPRLHAGGEIRGATANSSGVRVAEMDSFTIGPATMRHVPLYFSGDAVGEEQPLLILGANLLNLFDAFAIDFPRAELQIRVPKPAG
jgi:predicted aspartyl protease